MENVGFISHISHLEHNKEITGSVKVNGTCSLFTKKGLRRCRCISTSVRKVKEIMAFRISNFLFSLLKQPSYGYGRFPMTGGFQDKIE